MDITTILTRRISEFNLTTEQVTQIQTYVEFLLKVNKKISLTRVGDFNQWFINHVEDSIKAYEVFSTLKAAKFIDCGSGNGLPGVIFAILSNLPFILCDVDQRKCEFLKSAIFRLKLPGEVHASSILDLASSAEADTCFVYRGLGPDEILSEVFSRAFDSMHFRFISQTQESLFADSSREIYGLSDSSSRYLEISR